MASGRRKYSRGGGGHGWTSLFGTLSDAEKAFVEQRARECQVLVAHGLMTEEEAIEQIREDLKAWREQRQYISRRCDSAHRRGGRR